MTIRDAVLIALTDYYDDEPFAEDMIDALIYERSRGLTKKVEEVSVYKSIWEAISGHQTGETGELIRLMKLSEEVGEVMEAYIGYAGANKRKGFSHDVEDVADELCDVVITAMVALHDWVDNPERHLKDKLQTLSARIKKDGS